MLFKMLQNMHILMLIIFKILHTEIYLKYMLKY